MMSRDVVGATLLEREKSKNERVQIKDCTKENFKEGINKCYEDRDERS